MPRSLAKCGKRKRMRIYDAIVRFVGGCYVRQQFWLEYVGSGHGGLEGPPIGGGFGRRSCRSFLPGAISRACWQT